MALPTCSDIGVMPGTKALKKAVRSAATPRRTGWEGPRRRGRRGRVGEES
ncbi:hypothetical protein [Brachybacterium sacelli]